MAATGRKAVRGALGRPGALGVQPPLQKKKKLTWLKGRRSAKVVSGSMGSCGARGAGGWRGAPARRAVRAQAGRAAAVRPPPLLTAQPSISRSTCSLMARRASVMAGMAVSCIYLFIYYFFWGGGAGARLE